MPPLQNLAQNVRRFRLERGLSQAQLGRLSNFPRQYISSLERGLCPSDPEHVERLARALGITRDALLARFVLVRVEELDRPPIAAAIATA